MKKKKEKKLNGNFRKFLLVLPMLLLGVLVNGQIANFSYNILSSDCVSAQVQLTDLSTGSITARTWYWADEYGHGNSSSLQNPIITIWNNQPTVSLEIFAFPSYSYSTQNINVPSINCDTLSFNIGMFGTGCNDSLFFANHSQFTTPVYYDLNVINNSTAQNELHLEGSNLYNYIDEMGYPTGVFTATLTAYTDSFMTTSIATNSQTFSHNGNTFSNPAFSYSILNSNCNNSQVQLTDISNSNPSSWYWSWYDENNTYQTSNIQNPIISIGSGSTNIYLNIQDTTSCGGQIDSTITISGTNLSATPQDSIMYQTCDSTTIQFYGFDLSATSYSWYFHDGQTSTLANPVLTFDNGTLPGFADLTISDGNCTNSDSLYITLGSNLCDTVSFIINDYTQCDSVGITFQNTTNTQATVFYDWNIGGLIPGSFSEWNNNVYAYGFTPGIYNITLSMYSDLAMTQLLDSETQNFTFTASTNNLTANFSYTTLSSNCSSSQIQLTDLSIGNPTAFSWEWYNNGWQNSSLQNPIITLNQGVTTVYLYIQDSTACYSQFSNTIAISGGNLVATAQDSVMSQTCDSTTIQFYGFDLNATSYAWYFHDGQTANTANPILSFSNNTLPGFADLTISNGICADSDSLFIPLNNNVTFTASTNIVNMTCTNNCVNTMTISPTGGLAPYTYSINNGANSTNNVITNLCSGSYTIDVTDANGCDYSFVEYIDTVSGISVVLSTQGVNCDTIGLFSATALVYGGSGNYTYLWSDGSTNSTNTAAALSSLNVIVTDITNGCTASASVFFYQSCRTVSGHVYVDYNGNCIVDGNDHLFANSYFVNLQQNGNTSAWDYLNITDNGYYTINNVSTGTYDFDVSGNFIGNYTLNCNPSVTVNANNANTTMDLFVTPPAPVQDLSINLLEITNVSPGHYNKILTRYCNDGTIIMNGSVEFNFDADLVYDYSTVTPSNVDLISNTLTWNFTNLAPGQCRSIYSYFDAPINLPLGTLIDHSAIVFPISGDVTPSNNSAYILDSCVGSWDPNDKAVYPSGPMTAQQKDHSYHINFQNEGTANATLVVIEDDLDESLDIATLRNVSASHNFVMTIEDIDKLVFTFNNIQLTPKAIDEPNSKGSIDFTISQHADLPIGTVIENTAEIYFDFNEAIITNTTQNVIIEKTTGISELELLEEISIHPNPSNGLFNITTENGNEILAIEVFDVLGKKVFSANELATEKAMLNLKNTATGIYIMKVQTQKGVASKRIILQKK